MTITTTGDGGKVPAVATRHIIALYTPGDGRIAHLHEVVVFEGGKAVSQADAEKGALEVAGRKGHDVAKLKLLYVGSQLPPSRGAYRVDVERGALVATVPPSRVKVPPNKPGALP